jgi:hypothetical protein
MTSAALASLFQGLALLASILTVQKLYRTGLYKQYPAFFAYFLFRIPNTLWAILIPNTSTSDLYFFLFVFTLPLQLLFYILMVAELYRLVLRDYRGLQTVGRWVMYLSLIGSIAISFLTLIPKIQPAMRQGTKVMGFIITGERTVVTALALFIVLLLVVLSRYPIRLKRNVRVHAVVYAIFFFSHTIGAITRTVLGLKLAVPVATAFLIINLCSIIAWLVLLQPESEQVAVRTARPDTEREKRLLLQLDSLNAALLRVSRQRVG